MSGCVMRNPEPSQWEKRWKRIEVLSAVILTATGIVIAILVGIAQHKITDVGTQIAKRQALANLIIALGDDKKKKRKVAAIGLAQFGHEAVRPLKLALGDDDKDVQLSAINAFMHIHDLYNPPQMADDLCRIIREGENERAIKGSVIILLRIKYTELHSIICESESKKKSFMVSVNTLQNEKAIEHLTKIADDSSLSTDSRRFVIQALGEVGLTEGKPVVNYLMGKRTEKGIDENTQVIIVNSLAKIMEKKKSDVEIIPKLKTMFVKLTMSKSDQIRTYAIDGLKLFIDEKNVRNAIEKAASEKDPNFSMSSEQARKIVDSI